MKRSADTNSSRGDVMLGGIEALHSPFFPAKKFCPRWDWQTSLYTSLLKTGYSQTIL